MNPLERLTHRPLYFDGGTGSVLQARGLLPGELPELWNLSRPEEIVRLHTEYLDAGADIIKTNTFGANRLKFTGKNGMPSVKEIVAAALKNAKDACMGRADKFIALDIGPCGKLLKPLGDLAFEDAVELFAEVVRAGASEADLILIETMNDSYETKAAVLAAKENSSLPVFVTNVYDATQKLMTGASPEAMVALLEGLGVDALGVNCSLGPIELRPTVKRLLAAASIPVIVNPNAGLPQEIDGKTVYSITAEQFASEMQEMVQEGVRLAGGCCGTTPAHIREVVRATSKISPVPTVQKNKTVVASYTHAVEIDREPILIGERINPTGKKLLREALKKNDVAYILGEGIAQAEAGAHVLDVNVGLPDIDEAGMMQTVVTELQAVCDLPLQIDTTNVSALERALRITNGKPMINSVSGKLDSMQAVFPLAKKYGGVVVALTLDENGIPSTAEGRVQIAERILAEAERYGLAKKDLLVDPLCMTVSTDKNAANVTLEAVRLLREAGFHTTLGVSNVSFGLPCREQINATFFSMALRQGLSAAILNPKSEAMMTVYHSYRALAGLDDSCTDYIRYAEKSATPATAPVSTGCTLREAIEKGLHETAAAKAEEALKDLAPLEIINREIVPALDTVGKGFEQKTVFLPQLLMSAEAAKAAFAVIKQRIGKSEQSKATLVIATVKGDIHDIGKNIVKVLLENYGYDVIDLGKDVSPEDVAKAVTQSNAPLAALSALMTTTVPAMEETILLLREVAPSCKVVVGGAVMTKDYADRIGADRYCADAMEVVRYAEELFAH